MMTVLSAIRRSPRAAVPGLCIYLITQHCVFNFVINININIKVILLYFVDVLLEVLGCCKEIYTMNEVVLSNQR